MIKVVEGDLLEASEDIIGHQVNCRGKMGKGLAEQIKNKYPEVYRRYKGVCDIANDKNRSLLGKVHIVKIDNENKYIANIFGQYDYGTDKKYTNYLALEKGLKYLKDVAHKNNKSVALPYGIGAGWAGGDIYIISETIKKVFSDYDVTLYKYNK